MEYKGYYAAIKYDADSEVLHGMVVGSRDIIMFEAASVEELKKEFKFSIDDYIASCEEAGEQPDESCTFLAASAEELKKEFKFLIDGYIASCEERGERPDEAFTFLVASVEELKKEFKSSIDDYIASCEEAGERL